MAILDIIAPEAYVKKVFKDFKGKWIAHYDIKIRSKTKCPYWKEPEHTQASIVFTMGAHNVEEWEKVLADITGINEFVLFDDGSGNLELQHFPPYPTPITVENPWFCLFMDRRFDLTGVNL